MERAKGLLRPEKWEKIPESVEKSAAQLLGAGYGLTFGVLFELLHRKRSNLLLEGTALGLAIWAIGHLGWLPATGIMRPVTRQKPGQVAVAVLNHIYPLPAP